MNYLEFNAKNVLASYFASLMLLSAFQTFSKGSAYDCGEKVVASLFDKSTHVHLAPREFDAFNPLIEEVLNKGLEPQFAFRGKCGNLVMAGVKEHQALPEDEARAKMTRDSAWIGIHTTAVVVNLCKVRVKEKNGEPSKSCTDPAFTLSAALSEIVRHERTTWIPTLVEHRMLQELKQLEQSPQMTLLAAQTPHVDSERARVFINDVAQNLYAGLAQDAMKRSIASIAAHAEMSFLKSLRRRE